MTRRSSRVLFLASHLGYGGSEGQLRLLATCMAGRRFFPHILVYHRSPNRDHADELRAAGVPIEEMQGARGVLGKLRFTIAHVRRVRPDVVHAWAVHDNPYAAAAGALGGAPVRWGSLRGSVTLPGFRGMPWVVRRAALRSVQRVVVNSLALADELRALGLRGDRISVLRNCVDGSLLTVQRRPGLDLPEMGIRPEHRVICNVGNIRRVKNQKVFVQAMAGVLRVFPEARGVLVGETLPGEEEVRLGIEEEISRLGLEGKVILAGFRGDVADLLRGAAALCHTSSSEGMPNVVLEAMAVGTPVVATSVGGVPELVRHDESGLLVPPGDAHAAAAALVRVLREGALAGRLAGAARSRAAAEHSPESAARRLEALYEEALASRGRAGHVREPGSVEERTS